ncbi:hypothetical protein MIND_01407800 [Mycena indigotica]|uniref:Uncharacterized protein n=1 Tax=Mycena indigotica TaxID=2126181 RepID=A0A8H6VR41_9AGAR|nr:uncharacterized protein MIND_01407800 [Mycena indigotica]KAF7288916.1 hypothetical protein MIND_01407800 [Mycena indigotica]
MSITTTATAPSLPHAQRQRLMRSMHKLEAVLGETPYVVLESTSPGHHSRSFSAAPLPKMYTPNERTSSLRRVHSSRRAQQESVAVAGRPMLVIDVPSATLMSPTSLAMLNPDLAPASPLTPPADDVSPTSDAARRRKLAKVMRTLGENVPPALVFPESSPTPQTVKSRRRASTLTSQVPDVVMPSPRHNTTTMLRPPSPTPTAPRLSNDSQRSYTSMSSHSHSNASSGSQHSREYLVPTHRSEKGWSGEWAGNMSMDDVVKGLRGLKMK